MIGAIRCWCTRVVFELKPDVNPAAKMYNITDEINDYFSIQPKVIYIRVERNYLVAGYNGGEGITNRARYIRLINSVRQAESVEYHFTYTNLVYPQNSDVK